MTSPRPTLTPEIYARFAAYLDKNPMWGSLHIVLEDFNVADHHVAFCVQWAHDHEDPEGEALARILRSMTRTQRGRIARRVR